MPELPYSLKFQSGCEFNVIKN